MPISLSVVVPVLKEFGNLAGTVEYIRENLKKLMANEKISNWEIIIVSSVDETGQEDGTPELANQLALTYPEHITVIHNQQYANLGRKYLQGLTKAKFDYFMMVPGKNTLHGDSIERLLNYVPPGGIVIGYQASMHNRPLSRRFISRSFCLFMNLIFGLRLRYYNGATVIPTKLLRELNPQIEDFAYMADILVTLVKLYRVPYIEAPFLTKGRRKYGKTNATSWHNIKSVVLTILHLIKKVYWKNNFILRMAKEITYRIQYFLPGVSPEKKYRFALVDCGRLYRSAQLSIKELYYFSLRYRIRSVIILTELCPFSKETFEKRSIKVKHIPIAPNTVPTEEDIKIFLEFVAERNNQPVLISCQQGRDRTGYFCFMYRVQQMAWSVELAWQELKEFGFYRFHGITGQIEISVKLYENKERFF